MKPEEVLQKLPKHTPVWAIGITSVVVSFAVCLASMYLVVRPEVQDYLKEGYKAEEKKFENEHNLASSILGIVKANSEQISTLSIALADAQEQNIALTARVSMIEKALEDCQGKLKIKKG